ncbi:hypothetical protein [Lyngbya confervoides]|uniref:Uncharacterized protein n=1 Tax=Lyngbya confervoides BDU141951 TaxID=1574623 RepID=A0ABD4T631_9CYAN|nr:hypothetical protein [Lyngbya confervoides]MCM1984182.1 hypothetical protein [Lyngbya confervoides BDU141951]
MKQQTRKSPLIGFILIFNDPKAKLDFLPAFSSHQTQRDQTGSAIAFTPASVLRPITGASACNRKTPVKFPEKRAWATNSPTLLPHSILF